MSNKQDQQPPTESHSGGLSPKEYERIGRGLENVIIAGRYSKRRLFWFNFLRGIVFGLGSALGATLIIAGVLYLLSLFSELPWIGQIFESLRNAVESVNESVNN